MNKTEKFNSISHLVGAVLALAGIVVLLVSATGGGDIKRIIAFSVYGATLFLLYLVSSLSHALTGRARHVFRILDYQAIYLLIAGSYTPFTLVTLNGRPGWWLFGTIWSLALFGIIFDALPRRRQRVAPLIIYFVMGLLILLVIKPLLAVLPLAGFLWLVAGGAFYATGMIFFSLDSRYPWMHGVWHLFVLAGSISHYVAILVYV